MASIIIIRSVGFEKWALLSVRLCPRASSAQRSSSAPRRLTPLRVKIQLHAQGPAVTPGEWLQPVQKWSRGTDKDTKYITEEYPGVLARKSFCIELLLGVLAEWEVLSSL